MQVAHPRKGSNPQYENNDILLHTIQQLPVIWMHCPLETWHHTFWHKDTNLSKKEDSGLVGYDTTSLGKRFCVFLRNIWPWFSDIHRPMIHWSLEDESHMVRSTSETIYPATHYHIPENQSPRLHHCHKFSALRLSTWYHTYLRRHVKLSWWRLWTLLFMFQRYCCPHHHASWWRLEYLRNVNIYPVRRIGSHTWTQYLTNTLHSNHSEPHISSPLFSTASQLDKDTIYWVINKIYM